MEVTFESGVVTLCLLCNYSALLCNYLIASHRNLENGVVYGCNYALHQIPHGVCLVHEADDVVVIRRVGAYLVDRDLKVRGLRDR